MFSNRWLRYRARLISEATEATPFSRYMRVASWVSDPWAYIMLVGMVLAFAADKLLRVSDLGRNLIFAPFATVSLAGMLYAGGTVMYYGLREDLRRKSEASTNGR